MKGPKDRFVIAQGAINPVGMSKYYFISSIKSFQSKKGKESRAKPHSPFPGIDYLRTLNLTVPVRSTPVLVNLNLAM
jgi:hypothetical protein